VEDEAQLRRQLEALFELADLPEHFPLLRPISAAFDGWADAVGTVQDPTRELIDEGLAFLDEEELERIVSAHAGEFPAVWRQLCEEAGDDLLAEEAVLEGAIVAALREQRRLDRQILELIEKVRGIAADRAEALALALEGTDLWSVAEAVAVDEALVRAPEEQLDPPGWVGVLEAEVRRLATPMHERRLARLVARVRAQLPDGEYPRASRSLVEACAAFDRDPGFRRRIAALLAADALGALRAELSRLAA
jgi:hypothetical protein